MNEAIHQDRRRFFGTTALALAAARIGMIGSASAQSAGTKSPSVPAIRPGANTSFAAMKQIDAGPLNVGYADIIDHSGNPRQAWRRNMSCTRSEDAKGVWCEGEVGVVAGWVGIIDGMSG